jgi:hypothetical protein
MVMQEFMISKLFYVVLQRVFAVDCNQYSRIASVFLARFAIPVLGSMRGQ